MQSELRIKPQQSIQSIRLSPHLSGAIAENPLTGCSRRFYEIIPEKCLHACIPGLSAPALLGSLGRSTPTPNLTEQKVEGTPPLEEKDGDTPTAGREG